MKNKHKCIYEGTNGFSIDIMNLSKFELDHIVNVAEDLLEKNVTDNDYLAFTFSVFLYIQEQQELHDLDCSIVQ